MRSKCALQAVLAIAIGWLTPPFGAGGELSPPDNAQADYTEGMYCRLDARRGQFMTLLVSGPDVQGKRTMRVEDHRPIDIAASPALHQISCTREPAGFQCRWGVGGALDLDTETAHPMERTNGYYRVSGRWRDLPRTGSRPVECYVKAAVYGPTLD